MGKLPPVQFLDSIDLKEDATIVFDRKWNAMHRGARGGAMRHAARRRGSSTWEPAGNRMIG